MKKKEKDLTKKARKQIRLSLENLLNEEIKKAITGQGRNPKKAAKEIKKSVSLIAKTLAKKESLSQPTEKKNAPEIPLVRQSVKSFDVPSIPAPELPVVQDPPLAKAARVRKPTSAATIKADAKPASPARRGRKASSQTTAEAEATPVKPVRKRTPRTPVVKAEESTADTAGTITEESTDLSPGDQESTNS